MSARGERAREAREARAREAREARECAHECAVFSLECFARGLADRAAGRSTGRSERYLHELERECLRELESTVRRLGGHERGFVRAAHQSPTKRAMRAVPAHGAPEYGAPTSIEEHEALGARYRSLVKRLGRYQVAWLALSGCVDRARQVLADMLWRDFGTPHISPELNTRLWNIYDAPEYMLRTPRA